MSVDPNGSFDPSPEHQEDKKVTTMKVPLKFSPNNSASKDDLTENRCSKSIRSSLNSCYFKNKLMDINGNPEPT